MAFREVRMIEVKEVLRLWLGQVPKKRIARTLGLDPKTVRRYIGLAAEEGLVPGAQSADTLTEERLTAILIALKTPAGRPRGEGWERCTEQRPFIEAKIDAGVKLRKIHKLLRRRGVQVSYAMLRRFAIAELEYGRRGSTIPVADGEPGAEVQLDTGWVGWLEPDLFGKRRRFRAWIFSAARSRHRFVWPVFRETTETAIEACEEAWEFFGGIFKVLIPDNTRVIVDDADSLGAGINGTFLEYAQARGFHIDPARVRSPQDKARVERTVPTVREDGFAGEQLQSLEAARRHGRAWCLEDYGMRRHSTTGRLPLEHFEAEEKPHLLPAPTERYDVPLWYNPKVGRDLHAQVDRALYSLPESYKGKVLRARADRSTVRFYHGHVLIKTHPRVLPGRRSTDVGDFPQEKTAYAMRDISFLKGQAEKCGPHVGQLATILLDGPLPWTRMRRVYALLSLVRKYSEKRVDETCAIALAFDMHDVRRLQRMLKNGTAPPTVSPPPLSKVIPLARYLRPATQFALPLAAPKPVTSESTQGDD